MYCLIFVVSVRALLPAQTNRATSKARPQAVEVGKEAFASNCSGCHGLDGRGGERAPNIVSGARTQRISDLELTRIVTNGVPGTGMPSFRSLGPLGVKAVVAHLRTLQGQHQTAALPGDPARGKEIYFRSAACSQCHAMAGVGGFAGPDVSAFSATHSAQEVRSAITNTADRSLGKGPVKVIANNGAQYVGLIRNEDNFSIQLQASDGTFHLLMKSEIAAIERPTASGMPSDYASRLSREQLDDLVSYLLSLKEGTQPDPPKDED